MQTSGSRSRVPPNHAATRPDLVSAMVEAWQDGNGALVKINPDFTMAGRGISAACPGPTDAAEKITAINPMTLKMKWPARFINSFALHGDYNSRQNNRNCANACCKTAGS